MRRLLSSMFVAALAAAPVQAQQRVITAEACADSTHRAFAPFIGEYDVQATFRTGPAGWDTTAGRASFAYDLGGCIVRESFQGTRFGEAYAFLALWGTSGAGAPIQSAFVHSQHGLIAVSQGRVAGRDSIVIGDSVFVRGVWVRERVVLARDADGVVTRVGERSEDGGATWFVTQRFRYSRRR